MVSTRPMGGKYVKRNIAIVYLMLEGAYRPGELFNITLSGLEFHDDFVRISTTGKTGSKTLTLVASRLPLLEWLDLHPKANDPDSYLLYEDNAQEIINYPSFLYLLKTAKKKANLKKRVWPYLFRHTALTDYSKKLGNIVKIYGNWTPGSNSLATYEHLANSDQEDAVLKMHGLKKENSNNSILLLKNCKTCDMGNPHDKSFCFNCYAPLH